jgi:hypothetical protein
MSSEDHEGVLASEESLDRFLHAFFHHTLPKPQWTHAAHVTLAACLLHKADVPSVLPIVRNAIRSYNVSVGTQNTDTSGYHETLTVFWLRVVAQSLGQSPSASRLEAVRNVVAAHGVERTLHRHYYSTDLVTCTGARRSWVEPDLKPLPLLNIQSE